MSDDTITYKGFCKAEHLYSSGRRVGLLKTSELRLSWMLEENSADAVHGVQFIDVSITNLATGKKVAALPASSPVLDLKKGSSLDDSEVPLLGATWTIGAGEPPNQNLEEEADYLLSGFVHENPGPNASKKSFELVLLRDFKSVPADDVEYFANWTPGASALLTQEKSPRAVIRDTRGSRELGEIVTVRYHGELVTRARQALFTEVPSEREAFYYVSENERYEHVEGRLKRVWDSVERMVDPTSYPYTSASSFESGPTD